MGSYGEFCNSWLRLFPNQFLLALISFWQSCKSPLVPSVQDKIPTYCFLGLWEHKILYPFVLDRKYLILPYGRYCPSVKRQVPKRVCKKRLTFIIQVLQRWTNTVKFEVALKKLKRILRFFRWKRQTNYWQDWDRRKSTKSSICLKCSKTMYLSRLRVKEMPIFITK